jgi:CubicO group peptidase (beta-lactamase class C family)
MKSPSKYSGRCVFLLGTIVIILLSTINISSCARQPDYWPTVDWKTSTPEEQGMDSGLLLDALEQIELLQYDVHSLLVIKNGYLVMEVYYYPYNKDILHVIYSSTKSFTSTLIGIAIDKGYIQDEKQKVLEFFPDMSFKNMDEQKENLTIQDFLTMRTGLDWPENSYYMSDPRNPFYGLERSNNWVQYILDKKITVKPATQFNYNSGNSHILAALVAQSTKQDAAQFAEDNLFSPLGISEFRWARDPSGFNIGGTGLFLRPRDMAKLGYLFLHKGRWDNRQIVSSQWVENATKKHVEEESNSFFDPQSFAYGYQWWIGENGVYSAQGYGGQIIFVVPDKDLIIVTTGNYYQKDIFKIIRNKIIGAVKSDGKIIPDKDSYSDMKKKIVKYAGTEKQEGFVPEQIKKYLNHVFVFKDNYRGLKSLKFISIAQDEIEVEITYHNQITNNDITDTYAIGLDNEYRSNKNCYDFFFFSFDKEYPNNVLMKGSFNSDSSISVKRHTLGTASTSYQTWRIEDNKMQIYYKYSPTGMVNLSVYGELQK